MDKHAGCCSGGDEVFLLCDKVQKGQSFLILYALYINSQVPHGMVDLYLFYFAEVTSLNPSREIHIATGVQNQYKRHIDNLGVVCMARRDMTST